MGNRPQQHIDTSAGEQLPDDFAPNVLPASHGAKWVNVGLFGDNGTGKTHAAGTFPKPFVLALDPGFSTLQKFDNADDIHIVSIPDETQLGVAPLMQLWRYILWLKKGEHDRLTLVLDSVTELHKMILEAVMLKPRRREAPNVPSTDDYIEANSKLTNIIRHLRDLPMNVVFTGHHKMLKSKEDVIGIRFDLSEKLSTALGGACDVVMHCTVHEKIDEATGDQLIAYVGQTVPMNGVQAKDRSGQLRQPFAPLGWEPIAEAFGLTSEPVAAAEPSGGAAATEPAPAASAPEPDPVTPELEPEAPEPAEPEATKPASDKKVKARAKIGNPEEVLPAGQRRIGNMIVDEKTGMPIPTSPADTVPEPTTAGASK